MYYVFLFRKHESRINKLEFYCCVSYPLKVLFVNAQGQFFSGSFPGDQIPMFLIMQMLRCLTWKCSLYLQ